MDRRSRAALVSSSARASGIVRVGVGFLILTVFLGVDAGPTGAAFPALSPGYVQEDVVDTTGYSGARSVTVVPGGSILVTAMRPGNTDPAQTVPKHFYSLPPTGGRVDDASRLPPEVDVTGALAVRGGLVYGFGPPRDPNEPDSGHQLRSFDPVTGELVREVVDWWHPNFQMGVDPVTGDLVLLDECECPNGDSLAGPIVRFNPETGARTVMVPDDPLETAFAIRTVLTFTPDGSTLFAAGGLAGIDAYDREGELLYNIPTPHVVHGMVYGKPGTCFEDTLFYLRDDKSLWAVVKPSGSSFGAPVGGGAILNSSTGLTLDVEGRVLTVTSLDAVTAIGPDLSSPLRADCSVAPVPLEPAPPTDEPPTEQALPTPEPPAPPLASSGDGGGASAGLAAPLGPPAGVAPQTATATQPQASAASQASQQAAQQAGTEAAAQASAAPNAVALADAPEDQPVMGFSASARAPGPPAWASLALGAAAVAFMAATTAIVTDPRRVNPATAPNRRTTR